MARLVGETGHPDGEVISIARPVTPPRELTVRLHDQAELELLRVHVVDAHGLPVAALSIEGGRCDELRLEVELSRDVIVDTRVSRSVPPRAARALL